jgi:hypothetical protein
LNAIRALKVALVVLLAAAALRDLARLDEALPWRQLYEMREFYCAGAALDQRADPYRYEPLHRCEHAVDRTPAYIADPRRAVPAPLPPYDFPPYMLLARLSFSAARVAAAITITVAVIATIYVVSLLGIPIDVVALAFILPGGFVLLTAGQIVPFALLALAACGVALSRRRAGAAGAFAALTLIEPHLGLPVCVAMLVWMRQSRLPLIATAVALAAIALLTVGASGIVEYATRVLPGQAAAETAYVYQYSLTYLLRMLGVPVSIALPVGEASYFALLAFGVWLGRTVARALDRPELIAYLAAACSVVAGPYVHMVDIPFAVPAALVLAVSLEGRAKQIAVVALCLLAIAWIPVWITKKLFLASIFVTVALLVRLRPGPAVSIATPICIALAIYLIELLPPAPLVGTTRGPIAPSDLAQVPWHAYVDQLAGAARNPMWLLVKVPSWIALAGTLAAALAALPARFRSRRASEATL